MSRETAGRTRSPQPVENVHNRRPVTASPARRRYNAPPMRRIALINQKGGVGKTTTAVNLGAALAEAGQRVVVCDLDPQANLTLHLGIELPEGAATTTGKQARVTGPRRLPGRPSRSAPRWSRG